MLAALIASGCGRGGEAAPKSPASGSVSGGAVPAGYPAADGDKKRLAQGESESTSFDAAREEKPEPAKDERVALGQTPAPTSPAPSAQPPGSPPSAALEPNRDPSMIVYTARVTMAVYQVDQGLAAVEKIARDQGGFLALKRDREITVRVPRQRFDVTLAAIDKLGDVLHRDVEAQDVTDEFVDLEIRIKNAHAMQTRLKALLEKAPVKEALEIEKELHRVTEDLERLEGRLKLLRDKIAYSTITVAFEPRGSAIQATRIRLPFPWLRELGLPNLLTLSEDKP